MPNIPQQETIVQYIANSAQTAYTFAFYAPEETDIEVYYQASNATPVPAADILTLSTDYTVTYNSDPITGGTITLLFTPTSGYYLTINRNVLASLNTNFAAAQTLSGQTLDTAFDRLLLLCQQNQNYALERNLSYIINTYLPSATPYTQLPTLAQNYIWIGSGAGVTSALLASSPSASVLQSLLAANGVGVDGSRLVGYYDAVTPATTTVHAFLANLIPFLQTNLLPAGYFAPFACAYANQTNVTIATATYTTVPYNNKNFDTGGTTVVSGVFTAPATGKYSISAIAEMTQSNAVGHRELRALVNGSAVTNFDYTYPIWQSGVIFVSIGGVIGLALTAGDTVTIQAYQDAGVDQSVSALGVNFNNLFITRVS